jgi:cation diffusion facilitator CzcD-associated flavoprotein CzcO
MTEHVDVVVVGAGLSGIGAACHLQKECPGKSFVILESRGAMGGTWDLFRYPGIRSDSDMFTLGYAFKPWKAPKAIADGPSILAYIRETAAEHRLEDRVRYHRKLVRASWSTESARWTLEIERTDGAPPEVMTCGFLYACTGYYRYDAGYTPELPGRERFRGRVVHPQLWSDDVAYEGKRVVVIGSGATAMTLVPELAKKAAHVIMLQRSPTYVVSVPARDRIADVLRRRLPAHVAYGLTRWKNVLVGMGFYQLARRRPEATKRRIVQWVKDAVGPGLDVERHFTPRYKPWDQRVCLVPDGDLFEALKEGRASVVTDTIDTFTETGIRLASGRELEADLVVTATGLELLFLGGVTLVVDGRTVEPSEHLSYKGMMLSDVPNLACAFGYTNASWTLKADLTAAYVCRVLRHMDRVGATVVTPRKLDPTVREEPFLDLSSGYVQRALSRFPKQGSRRPWKLYQNYLLDLLSLRLGDVEDGTLAYGPARTRPEASRGATVEGRREAART